LRCEAFVCEEVAVQGPRSGVYVLGRVMAAKPLIVASYVRFFDGEERDSSVVS